MASKLAVNKIRQELCKIHTLSSLQRQFRTGIIVFNNQAGTSTSSPSSSAQQVNANVPGLSTSVHTTEEPVGPGAAKSGEYKVPEYFNFNKNSYYEAEVEMQRFRCPQPSALRK